MSNAVAGLLIMTWSIGEKQQKITWNSLLNRYYWIYLGHEVSRRF